MVESVTLFDADVSQVLAKAASPGDTSDALRSLMKLKYVTRPDLHVCCH